MPKPKIDNSTCDSDCSPVSLLPASSKVIEHSESEQMSDYLEEMSYFNSLHSAFT